MTIVIVIDSADLTRVKLIKFNLVSWCWWYVLRLTNRIILVNEIKTPKNYNYKMIQFQDCCKVK